MWLCRGLGCSDPHWEHTPWSNCSAKCGGGMTSRQAVCMANASDTSVVESSACAHISVGGPLQQQCNLSPCEVYTWSVEEWGACNVTCGGRVGSVTIQPLVRCVDVQCQEEDHIRVCSLLQAIHRELGSKRNESCMERAEQLAMQVLFVLLWPRNTQGTT